MYNWEYDTTLCQCELFCKWLNERDTLTVYSEFFPQNFSIFFGFFSLWWIMSCEPVDKSNRKVYCIFFLQKNVSRTKLKSPDVKTFFCNPIKNDKIFGIVAGGGSFCLSEVRCFYGCHVQNLYSTSFILSLHFRIEGNKKFCFFFGSYINFYL